MSRRCFVRRPTAASSAHRSYDRQLHRLDFGTVDRAIFDPTSRQSGASLKGTPMLIPISAVRTDGGTQMRTAMSDMVVDEYVEALATGSKFPAIVVFFDGVTNWLSDGFHRLAAHEKNGAVEIEADVRPGTRRDAIVYSLRANETHGLRRTNADKRKAILTVLEDPEWSALTLRKIGDLCGVSHEFVARVKRELSTVDNRDKASKLKSLHCDLASAPAYPTTANVDAEVDAIIEIIRPHIDRASREAKVGIVAWAEMQIELHGVAA
jgi:hypothetical protein